MKKILLILIFISNIVYGQISINKDPFSSPFTVNSGDIVGFSFSSKTFVAGKLYLMFAAATGANNNPSCTGSALTWDAVVATGNSTRRMNVWRCAPSSTVTETVTVSWGIAATTGSSYGLWEVTGSDISGSNGANAIVQSVTGGTTGADPSISMSAISKASNAVISWFFDDVNPFSGTEESGWTEDFDSGSTPPNFGSYVMSRLTTTDNSPTVTASSSTWIGMAIELKAAGRRIFNTN